MKKITIVTLLIAISTLLSVNMNAQSIIKPNEEGVKNLKAYPETVGDLKRHVIFLEQKTDEDNYKVEIIIGKTMEVDCNNHRLIGKIKEETVQGWGFNYYEFETNGQVVSTMMACNQPKEMKFVSGDTLIARYNSRLPIVVYLPKDTELRYKIWTAGEELSAKAQ